MQQELQLKQGTIRVKDSEKLCGIVCFSKIRRVSQCDNVYRIDSQSPHTFFHLSSCSELDISEKILVIFIQKYLAQVKTNTQNFFELSSVEFVERERARIPLKRV